MAKKPERLPPLLVVSGSQDLLRRRFLREVVVTQRALGWTVLGVNGASLSDVREAIEGDPFVPVDTLAVVINPEKVPVEVLEKHHESKDYQTTLLLHIEGDPDGRSKLGKTLKASWAAIHKSFPEPSEWQAAKVAAEFVQAEMLRHKLTIPTSLATLLVDRSGADLGVLSFEVDKIATLTKVMGATVVDAIHLKGGMAPIAEASVFPIVDALGARNTKKLMKALTALRRTSRDDPTMRVSRLLATNVLKWLRATYLSQLPPKAAADELGVHPWVFESKILPAVQRWGQKGATQLVADLAAVERAVLNGAQDPWVILSTRLLSACG